MGQHRNAKERRTNTLVFYKSEASQTVILGRRTVPLLIPVSALDPDVETQPTLSNTTDILARVLPTREWVIEYLALLSYPEKLSTQTATAAHDTSTVQTGEQGGRDLLPCLPTGIRTDGRGGRGKCADGQGRGGLDRREGDTTSLSLMPTSLRSYSKA